MPRSAASWKRELAAVCCYFNPCHYESRRRNYRAFRFGILPTGIHLLTVELAFGDEEFELAGLDNVLQVRAADVMWQKERLLNIGIERLAAGGFTKFAWLDADLVFHDAKWPEKLAKLLDEVPMAQPFDQALLHPDNAAESMARVGAAKHIQVQRRLDLAASHPGFAWAARMDIWRRSCLYDTCIVGGGDTAILYGAHLHEDEPGAARLFEKTTGGFQMNARQRQHYLSWAERFGSLVRGKLGYLENVTVEALFHGKRVNRKLMERHAVLADFDPFRDIALNSDRCWRWATDKPELHERVRDYFVGRREDEA